LNKCDNLLALLSTQRALLDELFFLIKLLAPVYESLDVAALHVTVRLPLVCRLVPGKLERAQPNGTLYSDTVEAMQSVV
jgi:hypothetical protein